MGILSCCDEVQSSAFIGLDKAGTICKEELCYFRKKQL